MKIKKSGRRRFLKEGAAGHGEARFRGTLIQYCSNVKLCEIRALDGLFSVHSHGMIFDTGAHSLRCEDRRRHEAVPQRGLLRVDRGRATLSRG